jgi:hypothetical protein
MKTGININKVMYKFRFYISGKFKFEKIIEAEDLSLAWKEAHKIADEYPTRKFIEIANI